VSLIAAEAAPTGSKVGCSKSASYRVDRDVGFSAMRYNNTAFILSNHLKKYCCTANATQGKMPIPKKQY
jgi:hypothetical protein